MELKPANYWSNTIARVGPLLALVLVYTFFAVADGMQPNGGQFTSLRNLQAMLISSAPVVTAALGMTIIIISGGIDLSAGTAVALCATVLAWVLNHDGPIAAALIACVVAGCIAGCVNGILI